MMMTMMMTMMMRNDASLWPYDYDNDLMMMRLPPVSKDCVFCDRIYS